MLIGSLVPLVEVGGIWMLTDQKLPSIFYDFSIVDDVPAYPASLMYNNIIGLALSVYMMIGFYSIIYAYRRLVRPGVSIEMRKMFFKKHALYVIVFTLIWIIMLLTNYYELFNPYKVFRLKQPDDVVRTESIISQLSYYSFFITGQAVVMIRLFDPLYRHMIKRTVCMWFGVLIKEPRKGLEVQ